MIVLHNTIKGTYTENVPRKNSQKTPDIEFEYPHPYRAELVQNMPKIGFLTKIGFLFGKYLRNINIDYITMIAVKTAILSFI